MPTLLLIALVGFFAQLVDGSLGMAYGETIDLGYFQAGRLRCPMAQTI